RDGRGAFLLARAAKALADHHRKLGFVMDLAGGLRQDDRLAVADEGRGDLAEQQRLLGNLALHLLRVRGVVLPDADYLARGAEGEELHLRALALAGETAAALEH